MNMFQCQAYLYKVVQNLQQRSTNYEILQFHVSLCLPVDTTDYTSSDAIMAQFFVVAMFQWESGWTTNQHKNFSFEKHYTDKCIK